MKINISSSNDDNDINNIERIWAYLKLQQFATQKLIHNDMIEMDDDEKKQDDLLPLSLALKYKFVTPWTSMIVVKKKDDTEQKQQEPDHMITDEKQCSKYQSTLSAQYQHINMSMTVKLEDSNMANYGSEEHKEMRKNAVQKESAWNNIGQEKGIQIWIIEKFKVKHWPKDRYSEFYGGEFSIKQITNKQQTTQNNITVHILY